MSQLTITQALAELGVTSDTLTAAEKNFLDTQGYLPLPNILSQEQVSTFADRLQAIMDEEGDAAGSEVHQEQGARRLSDLVNKEPMLEICYSHPRVLAAISHVLQNDMKISSLNSRFALPGYGLQPLHADWSDPVPPGEYQVCNSIWLLDDFTEHNGATRVVPGTHRSGSTPPLSMDDPKQDHPDQKLLLAKAGTVVIFNSHTWHGGTLNQSNAPRRALHSYFTRRGNKQQTDQRKYVRPETLNRLSLPIKVLLDIA